MTVVNKHTKIISAAIKVFAKKGFFTARISDIAKEAKVADGTIYIYFNNKYDILLSIFEEEIGKIFEKTQNLLAKEEDPRRMLEIYTNQYFKAMKKNKNLGEVIHIELRQTNKVIKNYRNNQFNSYLNIVADIIIKGQDQGIFRSDIIPDVAKSWFVWVLKWSLRPVWVLAPVLPTSNIPRLVRPSATTAMICLQALTCCYVCANPNLPK